ncbi:hypothetical protein [Sphingorhabdus sp.]|uniref:hypothetical protein n=1 Tax=Sphingorhabdus sp. TaxID=1902408 RepID=UPI0039198C86
MSILELRLKPATLVQYNLPDILYPISLETFDAALGGEAELDFGQMLYELQKCSREGDADWQHHEPAMDRLAQLISPDDPRPVLSATGENWWLEVGPVDLDGPIVTVQRGDVLIAAMSATAEDRLRVASYRPLDGKSASYLLNLGLKPHREHGVCMRPNNWEYALDCSAGSGNFYAAERGEAYLSYWQSGIGNIADGSQDPHWLAMKYLMSRPASLTVAELGIQYSLADT